MTVRENVALGAEARTAGTSAWRQAIPSATRRRVADDTDAALARCGLEPLARAARRRPQHRPTPPAGTGPGDSLRGPLPPARRTVVRSRRGGDPEPSAAIVAGYVAETAASASSW